MNRDLEIMCENMKNDYTEGVVIIGPTGSGKNKYAMEISRALNRPYKLISFTLNSSSLDEFYESVVSGEVLTIEGIEFVNDEMLEEIYYILCIVQNGQRYVIPNTSVIFGDKPIYITKNKSFKCIILLNSKNIHTLTRETRFRNYLVALCRRFSIFMAPITPELNQAEKDRFIKTVYEKNKEKIKNLEENKMKYKIMLGAGRASSLPEVEKVYNNRKEGITLLKFSNGDEVRVTREKDDADDIEKAIAIAMVKYAYGLSKYLDACEKIVDSTKKEKEKKKPRKPRPKKTPVNTVNTAMLEEIVDKIVSTEDKDETGWEKAFKKAAEEAGMSVEDFENKLREEGKLLNDVAKRFGI